MNIYRGRTHKDVYLAYILYEAIEDQDIEGVKKLLLEKNADPNIVLPRKGISCFHLVIGNDSPTFATEVTSLILQNKGNPNVQSDEGLTPVHIAAAWGRVDILRLLLYCGGDPQLTDNCYKTPLHYALALDEGRDEAVRIIEDFISCQRESIYEDLRKKKACTIVLDKILLNNGVMVGEYQLGEEDKIAPNLENDASIQMDLKTLPQTTSQEYVISWCNSHGLGCTSPDIEDSSTEQKHNKRNISITKRLNDLNSLNDSSVNTNPENKTSSKPISNSPRRKPRRKKSANVTCRKENKCTDTLIAKDICKHKELSRESGIVTLQDSSDGYTEDDLEDIKCCSRITRAMHNLDIHQEKDASSDYCTCTEGSEISNALDKAMYEFSSNKHCKTTNTSTDDQNSFVSVTEVYKYVDAEEDVVLYEKRLLVTPINGDQSDSLTASTVSLISLPNNFDYDTDTLRKELTLQGFDPGPITKTTKRIYLRKLYQLKTFPQTRPVQCNTNQKVYSCELQTTLKAENLKQHLSRYQYLEDQIKRDFGSPDSSSRKWRGGTAKTAFTYLLLDSRITQNLPQRADQLTERERWEIFLSAIFYVGKAKKSRPFAHLNEAIKKYNKSEHDSQDKKISRILDIWKDDHGVICLQVFQNLMSVEAFTMEAAMISALNLGNITNMKGGEFYGCSVTWTQRQKRVFGALLLHKAMSIFLIEGERQIFPNDVK